MQNRVLKPEEIEPCSEVCHECGFLSDSQVGILKEELGLKYIVENGILFPCHLQLKAVTGSENSGVEQYADEKDVFKVCRGFVESMYLQDREAKAVQGVIWQKLFSDLDGNINPKTMTIDKTMTHHEIGS